MPVSSASPIFLHNLQSGAPRLDGLAGSLIGILDACLVSGFGLQAATITVASGVATLTTPLAHGFELHQVVEVAGATPSGLNGRQRVLSRTTTAITFDATGIADGAATGSITVKLAPAGWSKVYSGTNKAAYRSNNVSGSQTFLRVDDTVGRNARVVGYETMSDVDTGEGPFPTAAQLSGGGWWPKSNSATSAARAWTVVANDRTVYLHAGCGESAGVSGSVWGFGDFASYKVGDGFAAMLVTAPSDLSGDGGRSANAIENSQQSLNAFIYVPRSFSGTSGAVSARQIAESYTYADNNSGAGFGWQNTFPNAADNGLVLSRKVIFEPGVCVRGVFPGAYLTPQNCHASYSRNTIQDGSGDLAGRKLLAIKCGGPAGTSSQGVMFFDVSGPWAY